MLVTSILQGCSACFVYFWLICKKMWMSPCNCISNFIWRGRLRWIELQHNSAITNDQVSGHFTRSRMIEGDARLYQQFHLEGPSSWTSFAARKNEMNTSTIKSKEPKLTCSLSPLCLCWTAELLLRRAWERGYRFSTMRANTCTSRERVTSNAVKFAWERGIGTIPRE